ncbi:MAG: HlyD family secretion protein [Alteromonadaceae bacterium]|jgi:HlyD family secretion protein
MNKLSIISTLLLLQACEYAPTERVQQQRIEVIVSASGELESKKAVTISPPSISRMWQYQIKSLLSENVEIKQGELVVSFDDQKVTDRLIDKQADLDLAMKELDNKKIKEIATEQDLILSVAEKEMEYDKAQRKAEIVDNSRSKNDRIKAGIDFTIAENDLFLAREKLQFNQENKVLNLKLAKRNVNRLIAEVTEFNKDIERLKVKAPIDGMVIYKSNWQGEKPAVGESVQFGQPVIELAVVEEMQIKAQIEEIDSGKVKVGQQVNIILDGTQELVYRGKVVSLGRTFRDKSFQDKRRIFDAIIEFDETDVTVMRPGMTARLEVIIDTLEEALTLSASSVKNLDGQNVVNTFGLVNDEIIPIEVTHIVGNKVVISEGVSIGDEVVL